MKFNNLTFKIFFLLTIIFGVKSPFIDYFVVIEMFYLLFPFAIILLFSIIIFVVNLFRYRRKIFKQNSTFFIFIIPVFLFSQIVSVFVINKIQKLRSEVVLEKLKEDYKVFPNSINTSFGIKYQKLESANEFKLEYNRGFMVREIYFSNKNKWESFGWND